MHIVHECQDTAVTVWDDESARDRFMTSLGPTPAGFPAAATLEVMDVAGHPGALLRVGLPDSVQVLANLSSR